MSYEFIAPNISESTFNKSKIAKLTKTEVGFLFVKAVFFELQFESGRILELKPEEIRGLIRKLSQITSEHSTVDKSPEVSLVVPNYHSTEEKLNLEILTHNLVFLKTRFNGQ